MLSGLFTSSFSPSCLEMHTCVFTKPRPLRASLIKPHPFSSVIRTGSWESALKHRHKAAKTKRDKDVLVCCICGLASLLIRYSCVWDSLTWFACTNFGSYYFAVCANVLIEATYRVSLNPADISPQCVEDVSLPREIQPLLRTLFAMNSTVEL